MTSIADIRKSYERAELNEDASHGDPLDQFHQWLTEAIASEVPEPNAMTLATVGCDLRPSTRVVLIKGYDAQGIVWYTNFSSRKGQELAANPFAALQFHWVELERVVRIEGVVEKVSDAEADAYFHSRPLDSRIGAWASPQSQVISSRGVLVAQAARYAAQFAGSLARNAAFAESRRVSADAISTEAENRRASTEDVNVDEELVKLTTYQQAFNASARMVTAAKELYDILLNMV